MTYTQTITLKVTAGDMTIELEGASEATTRGVRVNLQRGETLTDLATRAIDSQRQMNENEAIEMAAHMRALGSVVVKA